MNFSLDLLRWRAHLASAPILPNPGTILWIANRHVNEIGEEILGRARVVSEFVEGFSTQLERSRANAGTASVHQVSSSQLLSSMGLARSELRSFANKFAENLAGDEESNLGHAPFREMIIEPYSANPASLASDILALHAILSESYDADLERGTRLLFRLDHWCSRYNDVKVQTLTTAPLPDLIDGLTVLNLRSFLHCNVDLASGPIGSIAMLQAAARFDSMGLGPYFRNVGNLARHSRDIFELAYVAVDSAAEAGRNVSVETCVALLARGLKGPLLFEVVDDLGDLDARPALSLLLARAIKNEKPLGLEMVTRLRDIALDNHDYDTALRAQQHICKNALSDSLELELLGFIHAKLGNKIAASQILHKALTYSLGDSVIQERLSALHENRILPFVFPEGFGSPENRRHIRQAKRSERAHTPQSTRVSNTGVEFTF